MTRTMSGMAAVVLAVTALGLQAVPARAADAMTCELEGRFALSPSISRQPSRGALWSPEAFAGTCSGAIDGATLRDVSTTGGFDGTFGDGPLSAPQGGATCFSNDGYLVTDMALAVAPDRFVRLSGPLYWNRVIRTGVGEGAWGGARASGAFVFLPDQDCATVPITEGTFRLRFGLAGDIDPEPNAAPTAAVSAVPRAAGAGESLRIAGKVTDADGAGDLTEASVALRDARHRLLGRWERDSFSGHDSRTLRIEVSSGRLSGPTPWTIELSAADASGHTVHESATVSRG